LPAREQERLQLLEDHRERVVARLAATQNHLATLERKTSTYRQAFEPVEAARKPVNFEEP
jgi:hypothetical protein